jgi:hypothetical protein
VILQGSRQCLKRTTQTLSLALTVTMTARGDQTHLAWVQEFESPEVAARMRPFSKTANEQNLDRLQSLLASENY